MSKSKTRTYICSWDCNGFESITDCTGWNNQCLLDMIAGKPLRDPPVSLHALMMRARFNPHRNPEVWSFNTTEELDEESLWGYAEHNPQGLVDLIRANGKCLYAAAKNDPVIK